jgi:transcriptional regulator with XRE-family HTH domain
VEKMPLVKLKELRQKNKLTQAELGTIFQTNQTAISKWEKAINEPDLKTIAKIADYFGVTVDYLMDRETVAPQTDELLSFQIARLISKDDTEKEQQFILDFLSLPENEKRAVEGALDIIKKSPSDKRGLSLLIDFIKLLEQTFNKCQD